MLVVACGLTLSSRLSEEGLPISLVSFMCSPAVDASVPTTVRRGPLHMQSQLGLMCPRLHPPLAQAPFDGATLGALPKGPGARVAAEPCLSFALRPPTGFSRGEWLAEAHSLHAQQTAATTEALEKEGVPEALAALKENLAALPPTPPEKLFPRVTFLGTSSSSPGKYRNMSGIWVEVTEESGLLLDCAECSHSQMVALLGDDGARLALTRLKAVMISHLHQDHHGGLATLLTARAEAFAALGLDYVRLELFCVVPLAALLKLYSFVVENVIDLVNVNAVQVFKEFKPELLNNIGLVHLDFVKVNHPAMAFGMVMRTLDNIKIVYSGDCRPDEKLVKCGKGAHLLIHEATFDEGYKDDAIMKRHSTSSEAINVGRRMGAKATLLTHFSTRYPKIPVFNEDFDERVGIAYDFMRVSVAEADRLHLFHPVLRALFAEEEKAAQLDSERKRVKRELREAGYERISKRLGETLVHVEGKRNKTAPSPPKS